MAMYDWRGRYIEQDDPDEEQDPEDPTDEWVLNCGVPGCLMPGYHYRSECHTAQNLEPPDREMAK